MLSFRSLAVSVCTTLAICILPGAFSIVSANSASSKPSDVPSNELAHSVAPSETPERPLVEEDSLDGASNCSTHPEATSDLIDSDDSKEFIHYTNLPMPIPVDPTQRDEQEEKVDNDTTLSALLTESEELVDSSDHRVSKNTIARIKRYRSTQEIERLPIESLNNPATDNHAQPLELQIPPGYEQLTNGIYVPRRYLTSPPSIQRHPSSPIETDYRPSQTHRVTTINSATRLGIHQELLYPLPDSVSVSSPYGMRWGRLHRGIDLVTPIGTPVLAALSGQVVFVGWQRGYGKTVILQHQNGTLQTLYAHLSSFSVHQGQWVQQGEAIARSGQTGQATGPHLHFELQENLGDGWEAVNINTLIAQAQQQLIASQHIPFSYPELLNTGAIASPIQSTQIRVALLIDQQQIVISSSTDAVLITSNQQLVGSLSAAVPVTVTRQHVTGHFFIQPTNRGVVSVNGHWYRGRVLIARRPHGLIVVNWVGIEDYLASVVGSEMYPNWHMDALKAQAIAARSYALTYRHHPVSPEWYDLTNTPRYQRYQGIEREFPSAIQAVAETWGLILTVDPTQIPRTIPKAAVNQVGIVEAMYASTQALTNRYHNGFGLSQHGAASLAARGQNYQSILSHYYPGAQLSQLPF